jgi:hypothetical protein
LGEVFGCLAKKKKGCDFQKGILVKNPPNSPHFEEKKVEIAIFKL